MLKIVNGEILGASIEPFGYIKGRKILGRVVLPITRWRRAINAQKYLTSGAQRHLDIGCGDGYFLKRSKAKECYGLDKLLGNDVSDSLPFPNDYFDNVTLLAVLEHLHSPQKLMKEIARVLKPQGRLIMTTPKKITDLITRLYAKEMDEEHVGYYDLNTVKELTKKYFNVTQYHTFIFGLNQAFCLEKRL